MEDVFLLFWEENDSDELPFHGYEVGSCDADWNAVSLASGLKLSHFLLGVYLNDSRSLEHIGCFVDAGAKVRVMVSDVSFLDDGN